MHVDAAARSTGLRVPYAVALTFEPPVPAALVVPRLLRGGG